MITPGGQPAADETNDTAHPRLHHADPLLCHIMVQFQVSGPTP